MPGSDPVALTALVCGVLCCVLLPHVLAHREPPTRREHRPSRGEPPNRRTALSALVALLCASGALLLIPWSAALAWLGPSGALAGSVLIVLVAAGALYALSSRSSQRRGTPKR